MNVTVWNDFRPSLHPCAIESFDIPSEASSYRSSFLCGQYELDETNVGGPTRGGSIITCTFVFADITAGLFVSNIVV